MSLRFNGQAAKAAVLNEGAKRLLRAAVFFQDAHKTALKVSNPRPHKKPSTPGEYPKKRTGLGMASVIYGPTTNSDVIASGMRVRIGLTANIETKDGPRDNYIWILERKKNRLGFAHTAKILKPLVAAILGKKV